MAMLQSVRRFCKCRSIELSTSEIPVTTVAQVLGVAPSTVSRWCNEGVRGSQSTEKSAGGRPRKLNDAQLNELAALLLKGATAHGWPNELWTTKRMAEVIRRHFKVACHPNQAWFIVTKY